MVFGDMAAIRRKILAEIGLQFPIHTNLLMTRARWDIGNVNESNAIMDVSGQGRTLTSTTASIRRYGNSFKRLRLTWSDTTLPIMAPRRSLR